MFQLEQYQKQYDDVGFVKVPQLFSVAEVEEIESELRRFVTDIAPNLSGRHINYSDGEINSIHALSQNSDYFNRLMSSPRVLELAGALLHDEPDARHMEFFAKPAYKGLPSPFHQDNFYWGIAGANGLTIWIAMDLCDETNGAVTYFKGSHKMGLIDHTDSNAPGSSQKIPEDHIQKIDHLRASMVLNPGDAQVHHSLTIHGSAPNKSPRPRRGLTMQFKGKNSVYDEKQIKHYETRLNAQLKARGQI